MPTLARNLALAAFVVAICFALMAVLDWRLGQIAQITRV